MDTAKLKNFAQQARRSLLDQIATKLGRVLLPDSPERRESPKAVQSLEGLITSIGEEQVVDQVAYTWFNRFCALRFMDVNRYTQLGTVSPAEGSTQPEILVDAKSGVIDDKWEADTGKITAFLDGSLPSRDAQGEAYRLLLIAVCNQYHDMMPFLFERIADYTELLIPDDLLSDSSILTATREALTEEACQSVEVIGWLYQFYISEKKDEVIGKVVNSEDIPAATQLFTPNWIVKYMVQNSLGAQWLATYPNSPLKAQMEYYIEPAEQTEEVNAQLAAITPSQLNPEELTLIDPASGSGHILVEAYELFKAIYLERGYQQKDVPQLILEKNLFGLDIDERAAQLTGFALMMKGRADDRRLFERGVKLNVMALVDSAGFDADALAKGVELSDYDLRPGDLTELKRLFEHATTFGSLIQVPEGLAAKLPALKQLSEATSQDLFVAEALKYLKPLVQQAELLAAHYDVVVANPPYMSSDYFPVTLKKWQQARSKQKRTDLYALFTERGLAFTRPAGVVGLITRDGWLSQKTYDGLRRNVLNQALILSALQFGAKAFGTISGEVVSTVAFCLCNMSRTGFHPTFFNLTDGDGAAKNRALTERSGKFTGLAQDAFLSVPGAPIIYSASPQVFKLFSFQQPLSEVAKLREGIHTGCNERFIRRWSEVSAVDIEAEATSYEDLDVFGGTRWVPYNKGGKFRRWYGNNELVLSFDSSNRQEMQKLKSHVRPSEELYFKEGATWSAIATGKLGLRFYEQGTLFDQKGQVMVSDRLFQLTGMLNSVVGAMLSKLLMPNLDYQCGGMKKIPYVDFENDLKNNVRSLITIARRDWDSYEYSRGFESAALLSASSGSKPGLESSYTAWITQNKGTIAEMKRLEEENNRLFIDAYGLAGELTPEVPLSQITLTVNPAYRYSGKGGKLTEEEQWTRFRQDTMAEFVSYAVGCMMGRYSLDKPGLILANQGDTLEDYLFSASRQTEPLDEARAITDPDSVVFLEDAVARCFRCGTESTNDEAHFVLAPYGESGSAKGRPLIYCSDCVEDQSEHLGFQQSLHRFSARQAIHREWCEPETLAAFLSSAGCFAHRVPMKKDDVTFLPDDDNVIPILDEGWFEDDITERFKVFLKTTFGTDNYEENLTYLEDGLFPKNLEGGKRKTIREYFLKKFYTYHVKYYKNKPIYWLFSSPKGAFQALIYLHRYRPDTVSVVRDKYLLEFKAKLTAKIEALAEQDTTAAKKEADKLKKKVKELEDYDRDVLFPLAQKRIEIDLDDGVKVNYNKFGMALKKVTGLTGK